MNGAVRSESTRRAALLLLIVVLTSTTVRAQQREEPKQIVHSIAWLVEHKGEWSGWGSIGRRIVLEGRYSFVTPNKLRLQQCPLDGVPAKGETFARPTSTSKNCEIEGKMAIVDGDPVLVVERFEIRPDDETMFRTRLSKVARTDAESWYELADWAEERATFYEDVALQKKAREARENGLHAEHEALEQDDADGLLALATKVEALKFSPRLADEYRHEGWRLRWEALRDRAMTKPEVGPPTARELTTFDAELLKAFPAAKTNPTAQTPPDVAAALRSYSTQPLSAYTAATDERRQRLQRAFRAEVVLREIMLGLDEAARNEEAIAAKIDERLPEYASTAHDLREKALAREIKRVPSMTQAEMAALANRFRKAGDPERASKVTIDWLDAKETRLRTEGAEGLVEAADYHQSLTGDEDKVAALLIEAHALRPDSEPIRTRLERLGYHHVGGRWTTDAVAEPAGPGRTVSLGVTVGMTPEKVTEDLGTPRAVSRVASSGELTEVWIYGPRDAAGFAIHIVRRTGKYANRGQVVKVSERRPR